MNRAEKRRHRKLAATRAKAKPPTPAAAEPQALKQAIEFYSAGRYSEAQACLEQILQSDPRQPTALHMLGIINHLMGDENAGIALIYKALLSNPDYVEAHKDLGIMLKRQGQLDEAVACYKRALAIQPDHVEARINLGVALADLGQLEEAAACYRKAIASNPDHAEAHNRLGLVLNTLGQWDEAIASFRKALEINGAFFQAHNNLGVTLQQAGAWHEAVASYRDAIKANPNYAEAHINIAQAFKDRGRFDEAVAHFRKAISIEPDSAKVQVSLGTTLVELGNYQDAASCFRQAINLEPGYAGAHNNLGAVCEKLQMLEEAIQHYKAAIACQPDYDEAHNNLGNCYKDLGRLDEARAHFNKAIEISPAYAEAHFSLALLQLSEGNFRDGWENYEWRWRQQNYANRTFQEPLWTGQALAGKRILVWGEQGVGDDILFASMIPDLVNAGGEVTVESDPRLCPLFERSFAGVKSIHSGDDGASKGPAGGFDFQIASSSLGQRLRPDRGSFPNRLSYLKADADRQNRFATKYRSFAASDKKPFVVGIAWESPKSKVGVKKAMGLDWWGPILNIPGVVFVNLQYGETSDQRAEVRDRHGIEILDDEDVNPLTDIDTAAAQIAALDMVISTSNAAVHLAGGLGVPTCLMIATNPLWYWGWDDVSNPWYPSVRIFRQSTLGDWSDVAEQVGAHLRQSMKSRLS